MSGSILPTISRLNQGNPIYELFGGGGTNQVNLNVSSISTQNLEVYGGRVGLGGGEYISTIGGQLFYDNGVVLEPISQLSSISTLEEWAYFPAISSINADGNDLLNANIIEAGLVSTNLVEADSNKVNFIDAVSISTNTLVANDISTITLTAISTIHNYNFISTSSVLADLVSTVVLDANSANVSSLNGFNVLDFLSTSGFVPNLEVSTLTATDFVSSPQGFFSTINGVQLQEYLAPENITCSTLTASQNVSTPELFVSSINGAEFNQSGVNVSTVNTTNISSVFGDIQFQLVSTLSFSPNINPSLGGVNLGLGSILGNVIGWGAGVFGAVAGTAGLATGIAGLVMGRGANNINNNAFEMVNGSTQLQVSTIGDFVSSIYRISNGVPPDEVPGEEVFISTIFAPGATLIRSYSDPINTVSTPNSTIQYYAPWVELPPQTSQSTFTDITITGDPITLPGNYSKIEGADDELFQFASYDNTSTLTASFQVGFVAGQNQCYTQFPLQVDNAVLVSSITADGVILQDDTQTSNNTIIYDAVNDRTNIVNNNGSTFTIAYVEDPPVFWSGWSSTVQSTVAFNLAVGITHDDEYYNEGGFVLNASTITVPQDGYYNITTSLQLDNPGGGTNQVSFWLRKNGVNVDKSASRESVANNEEVLGTVSLIEFANANDTLEICFATNSGFMNIQDYAAVGDVPIVPSIITNIVKLR
jgi:hypothetical protein